MWEWDESLYRGSAEYYQLGRRPYPSSLAAGLPLGGRLLDIGCGPGKATAVLAPFFDEVVAVDADAEMLRVAASVVPSDNVVFTLARAEELGPDLGTFNLVTFAQSFHWMSRPWVVSSLRGFVEPGGACVIIDANTHEGVGDEPLPRPRPPRAAMGELIGSYLGPVRRAGRHLLPEGPPSDEEEVMVQAGFSGPTHVTVPGGGPVTRTEDEVVAAIFSLSSATPAQFGEARAAFEKDLRALLRATAPDGIFSERPGDIELVIWGA